MKTDIFAECGWGLGWVKSVSTVCLGIADQKLAHQQQQHQQQQQNIL